MSVSPSKAWPLPVAIVATIALFSATFYSYAEGVRLHQPRGLTPIGIGTLIFAALMMFLTDAMVAKEGSRRIGLSIGIVAGETAVFFYALMFLLLNLFGS